MPPLAPRPSRWLAPLIGAALLAGCAGAIPSLAALPTVKISGTEYVKADDFAGRFGLSVSWLERGERLRLKSQWTTIDLEGGSRITSFNGLRLDLGDPVAAHRGRLYVSRIDHDRCLVPLLRPDLGGPIPGAPKIVAIDAGHGGSDNGTENRRLGLKEKVFTLDVALRLKKVLEEGGYGTFLTRSDDTRLASSSKLDLPLRAEAANRANADLFISIHFNALENDTKTHGAEIYTYAPQHQRSAASWGAGRSDARDDPAPVNRFDHLSVVLAHLIHREVLESLRTHDRGQKLAHWAVLEPLNCPGVLVEAGFLTNDGEGRKIATPEYRQQIAEAIAAGVRAYADALDRARDSF